MKRGLVRSGLPAAGAGVMVAGAVGVAAVVVVVVVVIEIGIDAGVRPSTGPSDIRLLSAFYPSNVFRLPGLLRPRTGALHRCRRLRTKRIFRGSGCREDRRRSLRFHATCARSSTPPWA